MSTKQKLSQDRRDNIIELFFQRVTNPERARKIIRLAYSLSEELDDDIFYATIYNYSKSENWSDLDRAYSEHVYPGDFGPLTEALDGGSLDTLRPRLQEALKPKSTPQKRSRRGK